MRIRSLELHGFKSFPDRTVLHFDPGISCIVGPNGCGKSNIVDALRWCIGEQSARSLRGGEMMDVIFAGSESRKPVGFAEVVMTLTTDGGEPFPGEFAQLTEVSVGRRLHRSGQSEYLINQRRVRRRDVVDLFLDTGVGNNLYSFIEQGRIGKIVHARPEERRSLVDEAAGISRYKARRDEAQQRLVATANQLDRAADVAEEMGRRVRSLARQVRKAARFRRLRARIRQEEVVLAMARYSALAQDRRALRGQLRTAEGELGAARRGRLRREEDLTARREELSVIESGVDTWRDEVAEYDARSRELAGTVGFAERRIEELTGRREAANRSGASAQSEAVQAREERAEREQELEQARERAERAAQELEQARERASASAQARGEARTLASAAVDASAAARAEAEGLERDLQRLADEVAAWPARITEATRAVGEASDQVSTACEALDAAQDRVGRAREQQAVATSRRDAARASVDEAEQAAVRAEAAVEARLADVAAQEEAHRLQGRRLEQGVSDASDAVEAARGAVAERVAHAQAEAERAAREARAEARRTAQGRVRAAQDRAQQWIDAVQAARQSREQALRSVAADAERTARRDLQEALDRVADEVAQDLETRVREARERVASQVRELEQAAEHAEDALAAAGRELDEARGTARQAEIRHTTAEARLAAVEASIQEHLASDAGSAALREAFPELRPLAEHLDADARLDEVLHRRLGDRLLLPVVHDASAVLALARHLGEGVRARVLLRPPGPLTAEQALGGVRAVADLGQALASEGAAVGADGNRIDADGVIHLGTADAAGARLARVTAERDRLRDEAQQSHAALVRAREAVARTESERDDADEALAQARDAAGRLAATLDARLQELRERARRDEDARRQQLRDQAVVAERERVARLEQALEHLARTSRQALDQARDGRDRALATLEQQATDELAVLDTRLREARSTRVDAVRAAASEDLDAATRTLELARVALETHRSAEVARRASARAPLTALREALTEARATLTARRQTLDVAERRLSDAVLFASKTESAEQAARAASARAEQTHTDAQEALTRARAAAERAERALTTARAQAVAARERAFDAGRGAEQAAEALDAAEQASEQAAGRLSEAEVRSATWSERVRAAEQALAALDARDHAIAERIQAAAREAAEAAAGLDEARRTLAEATEERKAVDAARAESWQRLERERGRLHDVRTAVTEGEQDLKRLTEAELEATRRVDTLSARLDATREDIDALRGRMEERYQLSVPGLLDQLDARGDLVLEVDSAVASDIEIDGTTIPGLEPMVVTSGDLVDPDGIAKRVEALAEARRQLERIGEVNLAAIEEWADVRERYADLEAQRADLEASVQRIRAAIAKMNRTCRQRFRDTFDLVNQHFQEMYPRLVGGGSARLALTDEEDLLETGVDIFVQPPGKRLQNLTLLSGGEKAMTAIALILSLFKVKPSPFCVLDEVDAPLDEANGSRFNEALREMAERSQFIVVTHNRKTMECAATLYGITMPQPGCSRLVSVQLGD